MLKRSLLLAILFTLTLTIAISPVASAVSSTTMYIMLYLDKKDAFVNQDKYTLDAPPTIIKGSTYVPAKFLGDIFGFKVDWNPVSRTVIMETPLAYIELNMNDKTAFVNGGVYPFDSVAAIRNERLLVKLTWLADYLGAKYIYNNELRRVEIIYVKRPDGLVDNETQNSKPVAKFAFGKSSYRIGEPVKYIDLSYDPDADGIVKTEWTGKMEAFFHSGSFPVTLRVKDGRGNWSDEFTRWITIKDEIYVPEKEYPLYFAPPGTIVKTDRGTLSEQFLNLPQLPKKVTEDASRPLLVSDSPETFKAKGILYRDSVNGKARLYAHHVNGMDETVQFVILATNHSDKDVTVTTTNKGEVYPSLYANIMGHHATVDFLLHDQHNEKLVIPAGRTLVYVQMPDFLPGQGVNVFYDVETNGEIEFSFVAMSPEATPISLGDYGPLDFNGHVRGTFPVSEVTWELDAKSITGPSRVTIGDNKTDVFVKGYDSLRQMETVNYGNYGVIYNIHMERPGKMAVLLLPRGGVFKGPFKINGDFMMAPSSGVLTAFDGVQILARTTGKEPALDIEFSPPAASAFPVDLIFYPLQDK